MVQRPIQEMKGQHYFSDELPYFVNRAFEEFVLAEHRHDFVEISIVCQGAGFHYIGDKRMAVRRGDVFYIPKGTTHVFRPTAAVGKPLAVYNCLLTEQTLMSLLQGPFIDSAVRDRFTPRPHMGEWLYVRDDSGIIESLMEELHVEHNGRRPGVKTAMTALVLRLLLQLHRLLEASSEQASGALGPGLARLLEQVRSHPASPPAVEAAARLCGLGIRQFERRFQAAVGTTYAAYTRTKRVELACRLLTETDEKIKAVAAQAGYTDLPSFQQLFKAVTGCTPSAYRKLARSGAYDE